MNLFIRAILGEEYEMPIVSIRITMIRLIGLKVIIVRRRAAHPQSITRKLEQGVSR